MQLAIAAGVFAIAGLVGSCASSLGPGDDGLEGLALSSLQPSTILQGSTLVARGASFVDAPWGESRLRFKGEFTFNGQSSAVDITAPANFVDFEEMTISIDAGVIAAIGAPGTFSGEVSMEVDSRADGERYTTAPLFVTLTFVDTLTPTVSNLQSSGLVFVNDIVSVQGQGLLLGGGEGNSIAIVKGCFRPEGSGTCAPVADVEIPVTPETRFDRSRGGFPFEPSIAGISPGTFEGTVTIRNDHATGPSPQTQPVSASYDLIKATIFSVSPTAVSLGQFADIDGGGFVGTGPGASTLLRLEGTYTPTGAPGGIAVNLELVPEFFAGRKVRYVVNEDDALGQALDLRRDTGTFVGTMTPVVSYDGVEVVGDGANFTLGIAPVKQVVYLNFQPTYVESLRHFGLRGVDSFIRDRVVEVVKRSYEGVNLEVRTEEPTDFALFSSVDIVGPDPNGQGLFGYDNSPGKDTDNLRLYDRIGGVNALTQEDGYAGYGGVFIESLFGFSLHPGSFAATLPGADKLFDQIFDAFRADRDGKRVSASDLSAGIPALANGDICPSTASRAERIACAVFVLGNLIGGTLAHEIGHSLGLANPYGEGFHNFGDVPARLMDSGGDRPFLERAEIGGFAPGVFCDEEYAYLRQILPTQGPPNTVSRPTCF